VAYATAPAIAIPLRKLAATLPGEQETDVHEHDGVPARYVYSERLEASEVHVSC
jgi:hypothetical protein